MEEALDLRAKARKFESKANSPFGKLGSSTKRQQNQEEAEKLYIQAATLFLEFREFIEAANCFQSASKLSSTVYSSASINIEAAKAWKQGNEPEMAAKCYSSAIVVFLKHGPQKRAALVCTELAQMYEELGKYDFSLKSWQKAILIYDSQNEAGPAAAARIGAADAAVQAAKVPEDYMFAIQNYEKAAQDCADNVGLHSERYKLKKYFLKSGLCYLAAGDLIGIKNAVATKYIRWDRAFSGTLEFRLLKELVISFDQHDISKFEQAMFAYDSKQRLDKWHLDLALKAKQQLDKKPQDELL